MGFVARFLSSFGRNAIPFLVRALGRAPEHFRPAAGADLVNNVAGNVGRIAGKAFKWLAVVPTLGVTAYEMLVDHKPLLPAVAAAAKKVAGWLLAPQKSA